MNIYIFIFIIINASSSLSKSIDEVFADGLHAKEKAMQLDSNSIPNECKSTMSVQTNTSNLGRTIITRSFLRGSNLVLQVNWDKTWTDSKSYLFIASLYNGTNCFAKVQGHRSETIIDPSLARNDYKVLISIDTNKTAFVTAMSKDDFCERYIIDGRDTHLIDDVEYAKSMLMIDDFIKPLKDSVETIKKEIEEPNNAVQGTSRGRAAPDR